ncbi:hypothetical protein D9757_011603 [Collybiopsis confluens]|uniref:WD40 repeat-like protein n=1 Tax=Collybiopsis confluens TaxID=2823264 RepID=A0A8H5G356_9AGAR|nr:hypothetical protein D9757_011603 [Collybiopsis confluens]
MSIPIESQQVKGHAKANHPGSHPSGGSEVSSQLEIPVSSLEVQSEPVPGNQDQQEAQVQASVTATDVGTRAAGVPVLGLNTASSTEGVGPGNNNGEHGQALPGPAEQDPGGEKRQEARGLVQMEATDQSRGDTMPADGTKAASPSPLNTGTVGPVIDDEHLQAQISTSTADKVLSAVEYIAPATQGRNKSHGKPAMSGVCKAFVEGWKGLHKVTEIIEPLLEGTPFKSPITVFNMISTAAETSIDNQDKMQQLFGDIKDYLEIVDSVAFSPDGSKIISGSDDKTVYIWDAVAGQQLAQLDGHSNQVNSVAFSPEGSKIVSGSDDKTVRIWDAVAGQQLAQLDGHTGRVNSVAFSPNGSKIVSGSADWTVRIWDAIAGKQIAQLYGHIYSITSVAFSHDGSKIASGSLVGTVHIWDAVHQENYSGPR